MQKKAKRMAMDVGSNFTKRSASVDSSQVQTYQEHIICRTTSKSKGLKAGTAKYPAERKNGHPDAVDESSADEHPARARQRAQPGHQTFGKRRIHAERKEMNVARAIEAMRGIR